MVNFVDGEHLAVDRLLLLEDMEDLPPTQRVAVRMAALAQNDARELALKLQMNVNESVDKMMSFSNSLVAASGGADVGTAERDRKSDGADDGTPESNGTTSKGHNDRKHAKRSALKRTHDNTESNASSDGNAAKRVRTRFNLVTNHFPKAPAATPTDAAPAPSAMSFLKPGVDASKSGAAPTLPTAPSTFGAPKAGEDTKPTAHEATPVFWEHPSQFVNCRMWIDEDSSERRVLISYTEDVAAKFVQQGYTEYTKNTVSDVSKVPPKTTRVNVLDRAPPDVVVIPKKLPGPRKGMTLAELVVEQFEAKIVDVDADEVYAPIHLWTPAVRKGKELPTTFCNRLSCYYSVRALLSDENPSSITMSQKQLIKMARTALKTERENSGGLFLWYEKCIAIYNANRS